MGAILERKIKLAREILDDKTSDLIIDSLEKYYNRLKSKEPCSYSQEELDQRLNESEEDYKLKKGIPHSEIKRK